MMARTVAFPPAAALAVALAACSPGGESSGAGSDGAAPVSAEAATQALAAFGLDTQGRASWDSMDQDGAAFTFTGFTVSDPEGAFSADRLVLVEPQITDEGPVFSRLEFSDAQVTQSEGEMRATIARGLVRDAGPEIAEAIAAVLQGRDALFDAADPSAGRFGEISIEGLVIDGLSETGQALGFTLASARAVGHDGETIEMMRLDDLAFETTDENGAPVTMSLGRASAEGVASALAGLAGLERGAGMSSPLGGALSPDNQYERFDVADLNVLAGGVQVVMPSLSGEVEEMSGGRLISRAAMDQLSLSAAPQAGGAGAQLAAALDQLGYEAMNFSFENAVIYDTEADRVETTGENYLRLEDGFTMRFEQVVTGVTAYTEAYAAWLAQGNEAGETPPSSVFEPLMFERMVISLEDESLLDRSLAMAAQMQGVTPEQLRLQAGAYVSMGAAFAGDMVPPRLLSELQTSLTGFIGQGGTLTVEMAPAQPVSVGQLMDDGTSVDAEALGLGVRHEAP